MSKFERLKLPSYGQMPGVAFHCSDVQLSAAGPRVLVYGGQRQGISGALYSFEQSSGDGYLLLPESAEGTGPPPPPRTQATFTSIGVEPQETLILFAGFVMNVGCENDLWKCTIGLDVSSMPVPTWEKLEPAGTPPCARYGHSATYLDSKGKIVVFAGQDQTTQYNDVHLLDVAGSSWSQPAVSGPPPMVRVKHTANAMSATGILVFGGFNRAVDVRVMADAHKLELSADGESATWATLQPEAPAGSKSIQPRAQHATAVTADGRFVFIFGGYDGNKCMNDLWLLELGSMALRPLLVETPAPEPRSRHTVHIINDVLHVFCGYDGGKPVSGDVFTLDVSDPAGMESETVGGDKKKDDKKAAEEAPEEDD